MKAHLNKAHLVKTNVSHFLGDARLYRLDPPFEGAEYVVASSVHDTYISETMVFRSNETGGVSDFHDLAVSGTDDHAGALALLGYEVT